MSTHADAFLGTWRLIPELSLYAAGEAPAAGTYTINEDDDGTLTLSVSWRMRGDKTDRVTQFGGRADGSRIALPQTAGAPDAFTLTRVDARTLDSTAYRADAVVAYARRAVAEDGALMSVVQEIVLPTGEKIRNFQVYRRQAAE